MRLEESKRPRVVAYSDIQDVTFNGKQIQVKLNKGKIIISNMHEYPLDKIYHELEEKRANVSA